MEHEDKVEVSDKDFNVEVMTKLVISDNNRSVGSTIWEYGTGCVNTFCDADKKLRTGFAVCIYCNRKFCHTCAKSDKYRDACSARCITSYQREMSLN